MATALQKDELIRTLEAVAGNSKDDARYIAIQLREGIINFGEGGARAITHRIPINWDSVRKIPPPFDILF
ncbi:MAG: hypothetical protein Q8Q46_02730 [Candidatus Giovannonibacteria bacterium]|nr:hypothetical protein [Candidatus Giovannonibacteria bacterium]